MEQTPIERVAVITKGEEAKWRRIVLFGCLKKFNFQLSIIEFK